MDPVLWAVCLCIFLLSAAFLYDRLRTRISTRLRVGQAPKSEFGLVSVEGFGSLTRTNGIDIILVHGLGSRPDTTWGPRKLPTKLDGAQEPLTRSRDSICWITDFLPEDISSEVREDIRVFLYNYNSYWKRDAVQTRLWNLGNNLLHLISAGIRGTEEERSRRLILIGHSYGGLVIKQALIQASRDIGLAGIAESVRAAFFLGTPHRGSSFSTWGSLVARALQPLGSNPSVLVELAYDSKSLLDMHTQFVAVARDDLAVINFFEERKTTILKVWLMQWDKFCVQEHSATYLGRHVKNIGLPVDHYGLNKFRCKDGNYNTILQELLGMITRIAPHDRLEYYSVPLETVDIYVERRGLSSAIKRKLDVRRENSSIPHALVIHGPGGTGKTQLALRYVKDHKCRYNSILWIDARNERTVRSSFERCATELNLSIGRTPVPGLALAKSAAVQAVLQWLRARKNLDDEWLVVIDNADDFTWGIKGIVPKGKRGRVIITTQDSLFPRLVAGGCEALSIERMEPVEARYLLLRHLDWSTDSAPEEICVNCDKVSKQLGYLAFAVDLAGAYVGTDTDQAVALKQYLADYNTRQNELLREEDFRGLSAFNKTVWTVCDKTLEKIDSRYTDRRPGLLLAFLARFADLTVQDELLRLASLSISDVCQLLGQATMDLPEWLLKTIKCSGQKWDSFYYRNNREVLFRYGLLQRVDGDWPGVTMHKLVQWRAIQYRQDQSWDRLYLIFMVAACRQLREEKARPLFRRQMLAHIPDASQCRLDDAGFNDEKKATIWAIVQWIYLSAESWNEAKDLQVQVMETTKRVLGEEHPDTLTDMGNLAVIFLNQGRSDLAKELEVQVIETKKKVLGEEHLSTLRSMANLAATYNDPKHWKLAEELEVRVKETRKKVSGEEHPSTLISMNILTVIYCRQGRWNLAEELGVQVMKIRERVLGEEHPDTLTSMSNLAFTLRAQGRNEKALRLMEKCYQLRRRILDIHHPETQISLEAVKEWRTEDTVAPT